MIAAPDTFARAEPDAACLPPADWVIDAGLVHSLLAEQHPDLAAMPLRHVASGFDNETF